MTAAEDRAETFRVCLSDSQLAAARRAFALVLAAVFVAWSFAFSAAITLHMYRLQGRDAVDDTRRRYITH